MGRKPGPVVVFTRTGTRYLWCRFSAHGREHKLPTGCLDEASAQAEGERLRAEIVLGRRAIPKPRAPRETKGNLEEYVSEYLQHLAAQGKATSYIDAQTRHFAAQFLARWKDLEDITAEEIGAWQTKRARDPLHRKTEAAEPIAGTAVSSVTRYKEEVSLSRFLHWAHRVRQILPVIPAFTHTSPVSTFKPVELDVEQTDALLTALPTRHVHKRRMPVREFFTVIWALGLRIGEGQAIAWDWIDFRVRPGCPFGTVTLPAIYNKNKRTWVEPLPKAAYEVLQDILKERGEPLPTALIFGRSDYRESLRVAARKAGLAGRITPHTLRHARITHVGASSRSVSGLQQFARHTTLAMTQRYLHAKLEDAAAAVAAADGFAEAGNSRTVAVRESEALRGARRPRKAH